MRDLDDGSLHRNVALITVTEVTSEWLKEKGACKEQLAKFVETFGVSARVDAVNFQLAVMGGFDLDWLARHIFSGSTLLSYKMMWGRAERRRDIAIHNAWMTLNAVATSPMQSTEGFNAAYRVYEDIRATENRRFKATLVAFYRRLGFG